MQNNFIKVQQVTKIFGQTKALDNVSCELGEKGKYVIQGASGSGKSTLLYLLGGLDKPDAGQIWVNNKNLTNLAESEVAQFRNQTVGFVFQFHFLLSTMNCLQNILLPAKISGSEIEQVESQARANAKFLGVTHCLEKMPYEISGGEQQRINILRATSLRPKLLLCDEPTGNLDSQNSDRVVGLLKDLSEHFQSTLILVTHDAKVAANFSDKMIMRDGRIVPSLGQ